MDRGAFAGRHDQLRLLEADLAEVRSSGRGRFVLVRGRRQVGKSRLIEEFIDRSGVPAVFFTATKGRRSSAELNEFTGLMRHSAIDGDQALADTMFGSWDAALGALARTVKVPTVVVVDEVPYLFAGGPDVEGAFQKVWDRSLKNAPVLLIMIGSDLAMMEALTEYGRPLYGRPTREIDLRPLSPHDVASLTGLPPVDAFDAFVVTGGFPNLVNRWRHGQTLRQFLASQLATSTEVLSVVGERMMSAEFAVDSQAPRVDGDRFGCSDVHDHRGADWTGCRRLSIVHSSSSRRSVPSPLSFALVEVSWTRAATRSTPSNCSMSTVSWMGGSNA